MSQSLWKKSLATSLLLTSAACGAPTLYPAVMPAAVNSLAASTPKYAMGAVITSDEPDISADNGMSVQADLPESADLRPQMSPIANQGSFGACTSFAIIKGFREWLSRKEGRAQELSPRFFWYASRAYLDSKQGLNAAKQAGEPGLTDADFSKNQNTGLPTGFAMQTLKVWGTVAEKSFPYPTLADFAKIAKMPESQQEGALNDLAAVEPPKAMFDEAKKLKVDQTIYAVGSIAGMRKAFSQGKPVVIAARLFSSFMTKDVAKTGMVPVPNLKTDREVGGHAMCAVGFDNRRKLIIVRNSWGTDWADGGYCYLPYDYFKLKDGEGRALIRGGWTIR